MDRFGSANCSSDGQRHPEAAAYRRPSRVCHQGAPGTGALCGLVPVDNLTQNDGACEQNVNCFNETGETLYHM